MRLDRLTTKTREALVAAQQNAADRGNPEVYPEHLMLGDDILRRARYAVMDIDVDDESVTLDAIAEVGPGGHFLGNRHTRRHMRGAVVPALTHQLGPDGNAREPVEVARERAEELWRDYRPEPLEEDKAAELARILKAADAELRG